MNESGDKKQHILEAAARLFSRKGYFQTSMKDIAAEAGIAVGTTYLYYTRKEDLLGGIYEYSSQLLLDRIVQSISAAGTPREKLDAFFRESIEFSFAHPDFFMITFIDLRRSEVEFPQRSIYRNFHAYFQVLESILREGRTQGIFAYPDNPKFMMGIMGFWALMVLRAIIDPAPQQEVDEREEIIRLILSSLYKIMSPQEKELT